MTPLRAFSRRKTATNFFFFGAPSSLPGAFAAAAFFSETVTRLIADLILGIIFHLHR
jgi:hypothetical protein